MRKVRRVLHIRAAGYFSYPVLGPCIFLMAPGFYALTWAELVGPFETEEQALRLGFLGTKTRLPRGFRPCTRVVEV